MLLKRSAPKIENVHKPVDDARARRVAMDISVLSRTRTGTAVYVNNLIAAIRSVGPPDLAVFTIAGPAPRKHTYFLSRPLNLASELIWLHLTLPRLLKRLRIDLLHMPANMIPMRAPCACVVTVHDAHFITHPQSRDRVWLAYARIAIGASIKRAARVITDSRDAKSEIEKHLNVDSKKIRVVYLGSTVRIIEAGDEKYGSQFAPYLLFTGATMLHKNVHTLVDAFARVVADPDLSHYKLIIAGVPADGHGLVLDAISRNGLAGKVLFLGFVSDSRLAALYANATLFVFPSKAEGFGLPPLEAMGQGIAVAASHASCLPEILGEGAAYFNPDSPDDMARVISYLLKDDGRRLELAAKGRVRAGEFTWEKAAVDTIDLYREVLAEDAEIH